MRRREVLRVLGDESVRSDGLNAGHDERAANLGCVHDGPLSKPQKGLAHAFVPRLTARFFVGLGFDFDFDGGSPHAACSASLGIRCCGTR